MMTRGLILYAKIDDDKHFANPGEDMWNGDSLQVAIDPDGNLNPDRDAKDVELGFNLYDGKPGNYCWTLNRPLTPDELEYAVTPLKGGYFIAARIKWSFLKGVNVKGNGRFGVNLVLNDSDDGVNRRIAALAPGLYTYKGNQDSTLCLLNGRCAPVALLPAAPVVSDYFRAKLVVMPKSAGATLDYRLRATAPDGKVIEIPLPCDTKPQADIPLVGKLKLKVADPARRYHPARRAQRHPDRGHRHGGKEGFSRESARAQLTALKARGTASLAKAAAVTVKTPRPRLSAPPTAIYERQIALLEKDLSDTIQERKDYYGERGLRICDELAPAPHRHRHRDRRCPGRPRRTRQLPVPQLPQGPSAAAITRRPWPTPPPGATAERPVIFSGYGHFNGAINDLEWFHNVEANAIQFETGPEHFITGENPDGSFVINPAPAKDFAKILERAWASNVAVIFLLSPHYYPEWALTPPPGGGLELRQLPALRRPASLLTKTVGSLPHHPHSRPCATAPAPAPSTASASPTSPAIAPACAASLPATVSPST